MRLFSYAILGALLLYLAIFIGGVVSSFWNFWLSFLITFALSVPLSWLPFMLLDVDIEAGQGPIIPCAAWIADCLFCALYAYLLYALYRWVRRKALSMEREKMK